MAETFAVLIVRSGEAQFRHFRVELRGDTQWPAGVTELAQRLKRRSSRGLKPELVAVAGEEAKDAVALAEELTRLDVASVVLPLPVGTTPERQLRALVEAALQQGLVSALTGLANTAALRAEVDRRIASGRPFAFLQVDIDNFKAYNDKYGLARGDEAICLMAKLLAETVRARGARGDLVAHIGGDDFAIVSGLAEESVCQRMIDALFEQRREKAPALYDEEDRARGYIESRDRRGNPQQYPLMTLSIGAVSTKTRHITTYVTLMDAAGECKAIAKRTEGEDSVFWDRRRDGGPGSPV